MDDRQWSRLKFFSQGEKDSHGDLSFPHPEKMSFVLMRKLDRARVLATVPFVISSSWRDNDRRTHGRGEAVDIRATSSGKRMRIVRALIAVDFARIGIYDVHIHADVGEEEDGFPQNVLWWGKSK